MSGHEACVTKERTVEKADWQISISATAPKMTTRTTKRPGPRQKYDKASHPTKVLVVTMSTTKIQNDYEKRD